MNFKKKIEEVFGNQIRVRVSGICLKNNLLLLVKHLHVGKAGFLWAPPGGGVSFGESLEHALVREFKEETGLDIKVGQFLFVYDFIEPPLHAIELFFRVDIVSGELTIGKDPEMEANQLIEEVRFCDDAFLQSQNVDGLHRALTENRTIEELTSMSGYYNGRK